MDDKDLPLEQGEELQIVPAEQEVITPDYIIHIDPDSFNFEFPKIKWSPKNDHHSSVGE